VVWSFGKRYRPLLGLDITTSSVKLIELTMSGGQYRVESYAAEPTPHNAINEKAIVDAEAVGEAIRRAVKRSGAKSRLAAIAISGDAAITKVIQMPKTLGDNELEGQVAPERVAKAVKALKAASGKRWKKGKGATDPYHAQLWIVGDSIGEACWLKGHAAGIRRKAPAQGKIRVDLSLTELLQLSWLAHLGFQHMMPNYRGFEIHRFSGEEDAREGAAAVGKIESVIPAKERPFADLSVQFKKRQKLIGDWWQAVPDRLTA